MPNARVSVTNQATGVSQSTTTTSDGIYNLPYLGPGTYRIGIEAQGFKKFAEENGMKLWRTESLNGSPAFIAALADLVRGRA